MVSSIAAAGLYEGVFREDMFEEADRLDANPYYRTKHESEGVIRSEYARPWRVYRPGIVVGDSRTGEMDKIDGPYYFFKFIQRTRDLLPKWMPTIGLEGGRINLVPVDFVVDALDHIAHQRGLDGRCFHLVDPRPHRVGDVLNIFARAAHAPQMVMRVNARMFGFVPPYVWKAVASFPPVKRTLRIVLDDLGIPGDVLKLINYPTGFDNRETQAALEGSGIAVPELSTYAWRLWDYWERALDPDLFVDRSLSGAIRGKVVLVTGASSGIGRASAIKIGEAGARIVLVARNREQLDETRREIEELGGTAAVYTCDVSNVEECDRLLEQVYAEVGEIDILVNNAGRSIRRAIAHSYDRFHDFERTMQLNYFGALRLIVGVLPRMAERRSGHIINISSIGVLSNAPRFSAYVASKAALDAFTRCAAAEYSDKNVSFTTINMPLVRTPMIEPTKIYQNVPTISPEEAADLVVEAIIHRPQRIATRLGIFAEISHLLAPKVMEVGMNFAFNLFPDSSAALGQKERPVEPSPEQIALAQVTRGIHW
jgi:NAD(P)-dependent dehydrogenase (short-subunit alcohol dehydrogenase family)